MPKVSVIIPNYNHAPYLQQRINSVLNQTYTDFEIIILDDCSTDNSKEIIEQYRGNEKVSCIVYNTVNSGNTFIQWDKGIQLAKGEYIWIAESDDWCEHILLENLVEGLNERASCMISYCQSYCFNDDGKIIFQSNHNCIYEYINGNNFIKKFILKRNPIFNSSMAIWRKSIYPSITKDFLNYTLTGDYFFWIELCVLGDVFVSGKLLNYFRQHKKNVSFNSAKTGLGFLEQVPALKKLMIRKVITNNDYLTGLKKLYTEFKLQQKHIAKENITSINNTFQKACSEKYKLDFYFFQKSIQSYSKRLLRL